MIEGNRWLPSASATGAVFALRVDRECSRGLLLDSASGDEDVGNPDRDRGCAGVDFLMEGDWYAEGAGLVPLCSCD